MKFSKAKNNFPDPFKSVTISYPDYGVPVMFFTSDCYSCTVSFQNECGIDLDLLNSPVLEDAYHWGRDTTQPPPPGWRLDSRSPRFPDGTSDSVQ